MSFIQSDNMGINFNNPTEAVDFEKLTKFIITKESNVGKIANALLINPQWIEKNHDSAKLILESIDKLNLNKPKTQELVGKLRVKLAEVFDHKDQTIAESSEPRKIIDFSEKNVANFLGDPYILNAFGIKGNQLEGNSFAAAGEFIAAVLDNIDPEEVTRDIQDQFKKLSQNDKSINEINYLIKHRNEERLKVLSEREKALKDARAQASSSVKTDTPDEPILDTKERKVLAAEIESNIKSMKPGETILLPSGWTTRLSGHAMICKIDRLGNGLYNMTVLNTGDGLEYHSSTVSTNKEYSDQTLCFKEIPLHDLCERGFVEGTIELRTSPNVPETEKFTSLDVYERLFHRFEHYRESPSDELQGVITAQRSGTCSIRVLMAYLDSELQDKFGHVEGKILYRKLRNKMNQFVLENALEKYKDELSSNSVMSNLLKHTAEGYARRLLKLEKGKILPKRIAKEIEQREGVISSASPKGLITEEEILQGLKTVQKVLETVESSMPPPVAAHPNISSVVIKPEQTLNESIALQANSISKKIELQMPEQVTKISRPAIHVPDRINPASITPSGLLTHIDSILNVGKEFARKCESEVAGDLIVRTLLDLPLPDDPFWVGITNMEERKLLLEKLSELTTLLSYTQTICFADVSIALHSARAIAYTLLRSIDYIFNEVNVGMDTSHLRALLQNREVLSYDKELEERLQHLIKLYEDINKGTLERAYLFNYSNWSRGDENLPILKDSGEYKYLSGLLHNIPLQSFWRATEEYTKNPLLHEKITPEQFRYTMAFLGNENYIDAEIIEKTRYFNMLKNISIGLELFYTSGSVNASIEEKEIKLDFCVKKKPFGRDVNFQVSGEAWSCFTKRSYGNNDRWMVIGGNKFYAIATRKNTYENFTHKSYPYDSTRDSNETVQNELYISEDTNPIDFFEPLLQKNLSSHLLKKYLETNLYSFRNPAVRTWFKLGLFHQEALFHNLQEEPLLAGQLFDAFNTASQTLRRELDLTKNNPTPIEPDRNKKFSGSKERLEHKKGIKEYDKFLQQSPLIQNLYFIDLKLRLSCYLGEEFNEEVIKARNELREILDESCPWPDKNIPYFRARAKELLAFSYNKIPPQSRQEWNEYIIGITDTHNKLHKDQIDNGLQHMLRQTTLKLSDPLRRELDSGPGLVETGSMPPPASSSTAEAEEPPGIAGSRRTYYLNSMMMNHFNIDLPSTAHWNGEFPLYSVVDENGNLIEVNILSGEIKSNKLPIEGIKHLYSSKFYREIFGDKTFPFALSNSRQNPVVYTIHSADSGQINIAWDTKKNDILWITRKVDGQTYAAMNQEQVSSGRWPALPNQPNAACYSYWIAKSPDNQTVKIFDKSTDKEVAELTPEGCYRDLSSTTPEKKYNLLDIDRVPEWKSLSLFEKPRYILAKQSTDSDDSGTISFDFNRYMLPDIIQFTSKKEIVAGKEVERLRWKQDPQWFISENQELNGYPNINCFLIVENSTGNRKIMLPKVLTSHASSPPPFNNTDFMTLDIDHEGKLQPKTTHEFLVAAYHSLNNLQYEQAMEYLTKAQKMRRYSKEELRLLSWIFLSKEEASDSTPNALAIRLYAAYLIKDNLYNNPRKGDKVFQDDKVPKEYEAFSDHYVDDKQWMYFIFDRAVWEEIRPPAKSNFNKMIVKLYESYLNVRKNVSASMRIDAVGRDDVTRTSLLGREDEIAFLKKIKGGRVLRNRLNYLVSGVPPQIHIDSGLKSAKMFFLSLWSGRIEEQNKIKVVEFLKTEFNRSPEDAQSRLETARKKIEDLPSRLRGVVIDKSQIFTTTSDIKPLDQRCLISYDSLFALALNGDPADIEKVRDLLEDSGYSIGSSKYGEDPIIKILHLLLIDKEAVGPLKESLQAIILPQPSRRSRSPFSFAPEIPQQKQPITFTELETTYKNIVAGIQKTQRTEAQPQRKQSRVVSERTLQDNVPDLTFKPVEGFRSSILDRGETQLTMFEEANPSKVDEIPLPDLNFSEPYVEKRYNDLKADYSAAISIKNEQKIYRLKDAVDMESIKEDLQEKITTNRADILKNQILELASKAPPEGTLERIKSDLALAGKKQKPATFADCLVAFAHKSGHEFKLINPYLTSEEIDQLHNLIGSYLVEATNLKHYKKMLESSDDPKEFTALAQIKRSYDPVKNPEMLLFEYMMGYILNPTQYQDVTDFITKDEHGALSNIFQQRMMGSGKTEVYGALIALLKADGEHLSIMVSPRSLFATNAQDIKERSGKLFGQKAKKISFSRLPQEFTKEYLQHINDTLTQAIRNRNFIIVPPEVLQSMENRYFEGRKQIKTMMDEIALLNATGSESQEKTDELASLVSKIDLLEKSLKLIQEKGVITFDEVDAVLDVRKELNFPVGNTESLNPTLTGLLKEVYLVAATDPEIRALGLNLVENKQYNLTKEKTDAILQVLAKKTCLHLFSDPQWKKRLCIDPVLKEILPERLEELLSIPAPVAQNPAEQQILGLFRYITDEDAAVPKFVTMFNQSSKPEEVDAAEMIMLMRQEFTAWLPLAWSKRGDEDYGFSKKSSNREYAIPYIANNTPNERAEFADPWETVNRTMQLYIYKGISHKQVKELYDRLKEKANIEWVKMGRPTDINTVPTHKLFLELTGEPLLGVSLIPNYDEIREKLNDKTNKEAMNLILNVVVEQVIPQYKQYVEQITNNAQNLSSMPATQNGYSGTIENLDTLPKETVDIRPDVGTKGKIIDVLVTKNNLVRTTEQETVSGILEETLFPGGVVNPKMQMYQAIIDIGPKFAGISSNEVAKEIFEYYNTPRSEPKYDILKDHIKGVIYWDDKTNLMMFIDKGSKDKPITLPNTDKETIARVTGLSNENIFYYYSHSKTTGAHAILPEDSIAIATVDSKTPLRNWLQGVMRMRQIWGDQHVETVVPKDIVPIIAQQLGIPELSENPELLTMEHIIAFCDTNESTRQQSDLLRSVIEKVRNHVRVYAKNRIFNADNTDEKNRIFNDNEHLFIRRLSTSLFDKYSPAMGKEDKVTYLRKVVDDGIRGLSDEEQIAIRNALFVSPASPSSSGGSQPIISDPPLQDLVSKLTLVIDKATPLLPEEIVTRTESSWGREIINLNEQEVDIAKETDQQIDQEKNLELENELELSILSESTKSKPLAKEDQWSDETILTPGFPRVSLVDDKHGDQPVVRKLSDILSSHPMYNKYATIFPENILVTKNFLTILENQINIFDSGQKNVHEVIAIYDPTNPENPWQMMIVSLEEAAKFKEVAGKLQKDAPPYYIIVEPGMSIVRSGNTPVTSEVMASLQKNLLPILFMTGDIRNLESPKWRPLVQSWVESSTFLKRNFLEAIVLPRSKRDKNLYAGSELQNDLNQGMEDPAPVDFFEVLLTRILNNRITNKDLLKLEKMIGSMRPDDVGSFSKAFTCLQEASIYRNRVGEFVNSKGKTLENFTWKRSELFRLDNQSVDGFGFAGGVVDNRHKLVRERDDAVKLGLDRTAFIRKLSFQIMDKVIPLIGEGNEEAIRLYLEQGFKVIEPRLTVKLNEQIDKLIDAQKFDIVTEIAKKQMISSKHLMSRFRRYSMSLGTLKLISRLYSLDQKESVRALIEKIMEIDFDDPKSGPSHLGATSSGPSSAGEWLECDKHLSHIVALNELMKQPDYKDNEIFVNLKEEFDRFVEEWQIPPGRLRFEAWQPKPNYGLDYGQGALRRF